MAFLGADPDTLLHHAEKTATYTENLSRLAMELRQLPVPYIWRGADSELFMEDLRLCSTLIEEAAHKLRFSANSLEQNAEEQEVASTPASARKLLDITLPFGGNFSDGRNISNELPSQPDGGYQPERRDSRTGRPEAGEISEGFDENDEETADRIDDYAVGEPKEPDISFDNDFPFESKKGEATWDDYQSWLKWESMLRGAQIARPDLDDATFLYAHYRSADGTPITIDLEEAIQEDAAISDNVDYSLAEAQAGAQALIEEGNTDFEFTGPAHDSPFYAETENWQKSLGDYSQWNSGQVQVDEEGNVRMEVTVHAEDMYNFNRDQADIATGAPDNENGRFSELGWAQEFRVDGEVTRVVEWNVSDPDNVTVSVP